MFAAGASSRGSPRACASSWISREQRSTARRQVAHLAAGEAFEEAALQRLFEESEPARVLGPDGRELEDLVEAPFLRGERESLVREAREVDAGVGDAARSSTRRGRTSGARLRAGTGCGWRRRRGARALRGSTHARRTRRSCASALRGSDRRTRLPRPPRPASSRCAASGLSQTASRTSAMLEPQLVGARGPLGQRDLEGALGGRARPPGARGSRATARKPEDLAPHDSSSGGSGRFGLSSAVLDLDGDHLGPERRASASGARRREQVLESRDASRRAPRGRPSAGARSAATLGRARLPGRRQKRSNQS